MKRTIGLFGLVAVLLLGMTTPAYAKENEKKKESGDNIPPVLHSISVQRTIGYPGGEILVAADAEDDDTGVRSILATFRHEQGEGAYAVKLTLSSAEEVEEEYSGKLKLPADVPLGRYRLTRVELEDREENRSRYDANQRSWDDETRRYPLDWNVSFTVESGKAPAPPLSCSVTREQGAYRLLFTSGDQELDKATLLFENSANFHKYTVSVSSDDQSADGGYRKDIPVANFEPPGTFTLKQVEIKGVDGVKQIWSASADEDSDDLPLPITASFSVASAERDTHPPALRSVKVGSGVRDGEDEKTRYPLQATVTDDLSGVEHITIKFKEPGGETVSKVLYASHHTKDNVYLGELSVKFEQRPGVYTLDSVTVCDEAGNRKTYCRAEDLTDKKLQLPMTATLLVNQ